jgi:hypothetical protein
MHIRSRTWWAPKAGHAPDEYEDAFWPEEDLDGDLDSCRFAVADGASEASFSGLWARLLVSAYGRGRLRPGALARALPALQQEWLAGATSRTLSWYAEEKLRTGSFAALAGLTLRRAAAGPGGTWEAMAVGDSCVFQVRQDRLALAFPVSRAADFGTTPHLLSTQARHIERAVDDLQRVRGRWLPGDSFFLLTDALACWFLGEHERGGAPRSALPDREGPDVAARAGAWVAALRAAGALRNDDLTLLRVDLS